MMNKRLKIAMASAAVAALMGIGPAAIEANAAPPSPPAGVGQTAASTLPVTGTLADGTAFTGSLSDLTTQVVNGVLTLTGTLSGSGLPAGGTTFSTPIQAVDAPTGCDVITLDLGPLHLDVLGLVIDLAPVNLDVTAVPGAGNLLGNLVCAVAGLLDRGGPLAGISALLNRLLTGLGL